MFLQVAMVMWAILQGNQNLSKPMSLGDLYNSIKKDGQK